jgi:hypothetical protein
MEQYHTVHADDIDDWIDTLRGNTHWGSSMDTIARATIHAMTTSDENYTGADLYEVFASPAHRHQFLETVRDSGRQRGQRALRQLSEARERTYTMLARRAATTLGA